MLARSDLISPFLCSLTIWRTRRIGSITPYRIGFYLVGRDGRIVYRGMPGPFGFIVAELEQAIERYLAEAG